MALFYHRKKPFAISFLWKKISFRLIAPPFFKIGLVKNGRGVYNRSIKVLEDVMEANLQNAMK
jgi:hypothetical protein